LSWLFQSVGTTEKVVPVVFYKKQRESASEESPAAEVENEK